MQRAARLLGTPDLGIKEISWRVGYRTVAGFYRACRTEFGMTPHDLRRALLGEPSVPPNALH